jgi:hypothetical protein
MRYTKALFIATTTLQHRRESIYSYLLYLYRPCTSVSIWLQAHKGILRTYILSKLLARTLTLTPNPTWRFSQFLQQLDHKQHFSKYRSVLIFDPFEAVSFPLFGINHNLQACHLSPDNMSSPPQGLHGLPNLPPNPYADPDDVLVQQWQRNAEAVSANLTLPGNVALSESTSGHKVQPQSLGSFLSGMETAYVRSRS